MQNQLQMISPINSYHKQEKIIKSSEAKQNNFKPSVLIPLLTDINNVLNTSSSSNKLLNTFFAGKEKQTVTDTYDTKENISVLIKPSTVKSFSEYPFSLNTSIAIESTSVIKKNSTSANSSRSTLDSPKYTQNLNNAENYNYTESTLDVSFMPFTSINNKYHKRSVVSNINNPKGMKNNDKYEEQNIHDFLRKTNSLFFSKTNKSEYSKYNYSSLLLNLKNSEQFSNGVKHYMYNNNSNESLLTEIPVKRLNILKKNHADRKKRSFEIFFNSNAQVSKLLKNILKLVLFNSILLLFQIGCEALKMLGPASVSSMQFDSIIYSMSDEELDNCVDLLGSFDINLKLAKHIWSKTKNKVLLLKVVKILL